MDRIEDNQFFVPATAPPPYESLINQPARNPQYCSNEDEDLSENSHILATSEFLKESDCCKSNLITKNRQLVTYPDCYLLYSRFWTEENYDCLRIGYVDSTC